MNAIKLPKVRPHRFHPRGDLQPESVVLAAPPAANALPSGAQITAGAGAISQTGNVMNIQQNTARMITNWQSFNIGQNATVNFLQPNSLGGGPQLRAVGRSVADTGCFQRQRRGGAAQPQRRAVRFQRGWMWAA